MEYITVTRERATQAVNIQHLYVSLVRRPVMRSEDLERYRRLPLANGSSLYIDQLIPSLAQLSPEVLLTCCETNTKGLHCDLPNEDTKIELFLLYLQPACIMPTYATVTTDNNVYCFPFTPLVKQLMLPPERLTAFVDQITNTRPWQ